VRDALVEVLFGAMRDTKGCVDASDGHWKSIMTSVLRSDCRGPWTKCLAYYALACIATWCAAPSVYAEPDTPPQRPTGNDRATVAIEGIRAGWKAIRTFHLTYRRDIWRDRLVPEGETIFLEGELFGKAGKVRNKSAQKFDAGRMDMSWDTYFDGVDYKSFHRPDGPKSKADYSGAWKPADEEGRVPFDESVSLTILATINDGKFSAIADWLAESHITRVNVKKDDKWGEVWELEIDPRPNGYAKAKLTVIPQKNFPILGAEFHAIAPGNETVTQTFSDFHDHRGILFAHRTEDVTTGHFDANGNARNTTAKTTLAFSQVDINGAVADEVFAFDFPKEMPVLDFRTKTAYQWPRGSGWERPFAQNTRPTEAVAVAARNWTVPTAIAIVSAAVLAAWLIRRRMLPH
jgi:hypothetical protein